MKCPRCKRGKVFYFPPPEGSEDTANGMACDNPRCDWQSKVGDVGWTPEHDTDHIDTRTRELAQ